MRTRRRPGFSLFQLLTLLGLLGLVGGLLFPAILKARQAEAKARRVNNLRQLAVGLLNYEGTNAKLPPGRDANGFSTAAYVLPYVEQNNLFNLIDFKKPIDDEKNVAARAVVVKTFLSPEDKILKVNDKFGATNYLFCAGSKASLKDNDGLFYQDSKVRIADIIDGTSNTMMAGETLKGNGGTTGTDVRRQHIKYEAKALKDLKDDAGVEDFKIDKHIAGDRCASWMDGSFLQGTFTATRLPDDPKPDVNCGGEGGLSGLRTLDGMVPVAMADGSVRTMQVKKLKLEAWKALATRAGGELVNPNDY